MKKASHPSRPDRQSPRQSLHDGESGYNAGMAVFSYVIGGIVVWTLIGWGLDNLFGTRWMVLVGPLLGLAGGIYLSSFHKLISGRLPKAGPKNAAGEENEQ